MSRLMQIRFTSSTSNRRPYGGDRATIRCSPHPKVRNFSARLASTISATTITYSLQHREHVHRLDAGNSCLGDNGCVLLFRFLTSPAGQKYRNSITELYLTSNEIGAKGLQALSAYLSGNEVLRELCLSGNPLTTDPDTVTAFAVALNTSRLCTLHLIHNGELSDGFVSLFLPQLTTPYLRQLNMSAIGMTRMSVPVIIKYVSSAVCRLEGLQCNANNLTLPGARDIASALEEHNYSLWKVTLDDLHIDTDHDGEERMQAWQGTLDSVCRRNSQMKKKTRAEALMLLCSARALFLRSGSHSMPSGVNSGTFKRRSKPLSPFFDLPPELQSVIMTLLAPTLSSRQRARICEYAADYRTLPRLDLTGAKVGFSTRLSSLARYGFKRSPQAHTAIIQARDAVEEGSVVVLEGTWRPCAWWECACRGPARLDCATLRRWQREMRDIWLTQVGCDVYEPAL